MTYLRKMREAKGMKQIEVAKKINISERMYRYLEHGQRNPSWRVAIKLEDLFNTPARKLLQKII